MVGISVDVDRLDTAGDAVKRLLTEEIYTPESLKKIRDRYLYHVGESAKVGAGYLLRRLVEYAGAEAAPDANAFDGSIVSSDVPEQNGFLKKAGISALYLLLPVIMLALFAPLEIYEGNKGELIFGTADFFWPFIGIGAVVLCVGSLILALFPEKLRTLLHSMIFSGSLMAYIQNMFLNKKLSKTDGSPMDWNIYRNYGIVTAIVWVVLIVLVCVMGYKLKQKREKIFLTASLFLCAVQLVASVSMLIGNPYRMEKDDVYIVSSEGEYTLASGENIIVIILDRYSNARFENMLEKTPEAEEIYKDFTFYSNANSRYNYTFPSVIHMLTHVEPDCTMDTGGYKEYAWKNGVSRQFHDTLARNGYTYRMYTGSGSAIYLDPAFMVGSMDNVEILEDSEYIVDHSQMTFAIFKTALLKYAPYPLKPYLGIVNMNYNYYVTYKDVTYCTDDNAKFYEELKENGLRVDEDMENAVTILHLTGIHNPYTIDENANPVEADSVELWQVQEGLNIVMQEYFDRLKEIGLYDSATIILTADHGEILESGYLQPIYMIKLPNTEQERMAHTSAPVDAGDFLATVLSLIGEDYSEYGTSVFDWQDGDERERSCAYPNNGFDVYTYTGTLSDLNRQVREGNYTRMDATRDWE